MFDFLLLLQTPIADNVNEVADNWKNVGALLCIILAVLIVVILFFRFAFSDTETLELGNFLKLRQRDKTKNKNKQKDNNVKPEEVIDSLDFILKLKNKELVDNVLKVKDEIIELESDYDNRVNTIFNKVYMSIEADLHEKLVSIICATLSFDTQRARSTREYFFVTELLNNYHESWVKTAKEIIAHNGFNEFIDDKSKCKAYINELTNCMYECLDISKMDLTVLKKSQIEDAMNDSTSIAVQSLERMFMNLAETKLAMLKKRSEKIQKIEELIEKNRLEILTEIRNKFIEQDNLNTNNVGERNLENN